MFKCPDCSKNFSRKDSLQRHTRTSCKNKQSIQSPIPPIDSASLMQTPTTAIALNPQTIASNPSVSGPITASTSEDLNQPPCKKICKSSTCDLCNETFPSTCLTAHLLSARHKQKTVISVQSLTLPSASTSHNKNDIEIINSAFKSRIISYRVKNELKLDLNDFLSNSKPKLLDLLRTELKKNVNIRVNFELFGIYMLSTIQKIEIKSFNTKYAVLNMGAELEEFVENFFDVIKRKSVEFSEKDSELDLDFLERRQNGSSTTTENQEMPRSPIEISPESVDRVKVILLGAPAVGKTSIIQQFVWNDFCEEYVPTDRKHTYYPSVITNDRLYEIKISDLPVIPYFPVNSYYEWANYRFYGLRSATAYILVFDLANIETFQYIRTLRDQICESRNMSNVPLLVVGNKQDQIFGDEGGGGVAGATTSSSKLAITNGNEEKRRDIVNLVKKHWKCGYIECSAKYNWKVVGVFKELITMIDSLDSRDQSPMLDNIQDALDRNKCVVI